VRTTTAADSSVPLQEFGWKSWLLNGALSSLLIACIVLCHQVFTPPLRSVVGDSLTQVVRLLPSRRCLVAIPENPANACIEEQQAVTIL